MFKFFIRGGSRLADAESESENAIYRAELIELIKCYWFR